jgi:hypothetical protein
MADGHGAPDAAASAPLGAHGQHAEHSEHTQHAQHAHGQPASGAVESVQGGPPSTPAPGTEPCTCIGPCAGAAVAVAAAGPADVPGAVVRAVSVRPPSALRSWVADDRHSFLLPFANGPPRA